MSLEWEIEPEKADRKNPCMLRKVPPKPVRIGVLLQLPSTFRMVQEKSPQFHLTRRSAAADWS